MRLIIPGNPIPKLRHRHTRRGFHTYNPQKAQEQAVKALIASHLAVIEMDDSSSIVGQIKALEESHHFRISLEFHCQAPKSDPWGLTLSIAKADIDNYCKFILDCCNSILYKDDHLIIDLRAIKCYSPVPKTIIDIVPMQEPEISIIEMHVLKVLTPDEMKNLLEDVSIMAQYSITDLEIKDKRDEAQWLSDVAFLQYNFAHKWAQKLGKIAKK